MKQALRVADDLEAMEEEEMMRRAIEESQKLEQESKKEIDMEEEMIRQAILMSQQEEEARVNRVKQLEEEQIKVAEKLSSDHQKNFSKVEVTVAQIKQRTLEQEKLEQLQKLKEVKEHNALPPVT